MSFFAYFMVWMILIIGHTLGIPSAVMGSTFFAVCLSVPDALSSIAAIKKGYVNMAVSNAIGSSVFDILICLGLPWFIQTAIIAPGTHVNVVSKGILYKMISLLSTIAFFMIAIGVNSCKLDKKLGIVLMVWYLLLYVIPTSLFEMNVFGVFNLPECPSNY